MSDFLTWEVLIERITLSFRKGNYFQKASNEKSKLFNTTTNEKKQPNVDMTIRAIENRQDHMIHRVHINMQYMQKVAPSRHQKHT